MEQDLDDAGLDRLLARIKAPAASPALSRRVLADFDRLAARPGLSRSLRRLAEAVWPGAPVWQPVAAFALALAIGLGAAAMAPLELVDDGGPFAADIDGQGG